MSGYKNMWFSTGEEHRAFLAFAAVTYGCKDESGMGDEALDGWERLPEADRADWFTAAGLVASDAYSLYR